MSFGEREDCSIGPQISHQLPHAQTFYSMRAKLKKKGGTAASLLEYLGGGEGGGGADEEVVGGD